MSYFIIGIIGFVTLTYVSYQTKLVFFMPIAIASLMLGFSSIIFQFSAFLKKKYVLGGPNTKIFASFKEVSKSSFDNRFIVNAIYKIGQKEYNFKSSHLPYNPKSLIEEFDLKEIPILVSRSNPKIAILDENFFITCMEKRNEKVDYLSKTDSDFRIKNKSFTSIINKICFLIIGILILILCILQEENLRVFLFSALMVIIGLYINIFPYFMAREKQKIKKNGIKLIAHVESIDFYPSYRTPSIFRYSYYTIRVSYVYNKKLYFATSEKIYFNFSKKDAKFLPIYILPNNPSKCYIDISYLPLTFSLM